MRSSRFLSLGLLLALLGPALPARALDLELVGLFGTGFDTGDADNNPYAFQIGGALELTVSGIVLGVRASRSLATSADCPTCIEVDDLRAIGADFGFDWELSALHVSPRFGLGYLSERNDGFDTVYFEPGGVAELEFGVLVAGIDVRYRIVADDRDADGLLGYIRAGFRF